MPTSYTLWPAGWQADGKPCAAVVKTAAHAAPSGASGLRGGDLGPAVLAAHVKRSPMALLWGVSAFCGRLGLPGGRHAENGAGRPQPPTKAWGESLAKAGDASRMCALRRRGTALIFMPDLLRALRFPAAPPDPCDLGAAGRLASRRSGSRHRPARRLGGAGHARAVAGGLQEGFPARTANKSPVLPRKSSGDPAPARIQI
jgi:hypothetical protein